MDYARRLLPNRLHDARMSVSQRIHAQSGNEVEVPVSVQVIEKYAFTAGEHHGITIVGGEQETSFTFDNLVGCRHKNRL